MFGAGQEDTADLLEGVTELQDGAMNTTLELRTSISRRGSRTCTNKVEIGAGIRMLDITAQRHLP